MVNENLTSACCRLLLSRPGRLPGCEPERGGPPNAAELKPHRRVGSAVVPVGSLHGERACELRIEQRAVDEIIDLAKPCRPCGPDCLRSEQTGQGADLATEEVSRHGRQPM